MCEIYWLLIDRSIWLHRGLNSKLKRSDKMAAAAERFQASAMFSSSGAKKNTT